MDNMLLTSNDSDELYKLSKQMNSSMASVGLSLRYWSSNNLEVPRALSGDENLCFENCKV